MDLLNLIVDLGDNLHYLYRYINSFHNKYRETLI